MTHLDLFSGIGGFALACRWAGIQTIQFIEIENYAQKVLKKNFPGVPIHSDIKTYDATRVVSPFILTGGYPCQPFSTAGLRRGSSDNRYLWPEMFRIIQECRPTWVLGENVAGHVRLGLDDTLSDLESEGYSCRAFSIPACGLQARHQRERVWVVAHSGHTKLSGWDKTQEPGKTKPFSRYKMGHEPPSCGCNVSYHNQDRCDEGGICISKTAGHGPIRDTGGEDLAGLGRGLDGLPAGLDFPRRWADGSWEEGLPRVTMENNNRVSRLKGIGNAIVPQIAHQIISLMVEASS